MSHKALVVKKKTTRGKTRRKPWDFWDQLLEDFGMHQNGWKAMGCSDAPSDAFDDGFWDLFVTWGPKRISVRLLHTHTSFAPLVTGVFGVSP